MLGFEFPATIPPPHKRCRRQIFPEGGADHSAVPVRPCHAAPHGTVKGSFLQCLRLVHVGDLLAHVPVSILRGVHMLNLNKGCVGVLVRFAPFEAEDGPTGV